MRPLKLMMLHGVPVSATILKRGQALPGIPLSTGILCGDLCDRDEVLDSVRHDGLMPACAEFWAKTYKRPEFVDADSKLGAKQLNEVRWPLTLGVLWIAHQGDAEAAARDWTGFELAWREGIWNGRAELRDKAELKLWDALKRGTVGAFARDLDHGYKRIESFEWETLEWIDRGPFQKVGHGGQGAIYRFVIVDAAAVRGLIDTRPAEPPAQSAVKISDYPVQAEPALIPAVDSDPDDALRQEIRDDLNRVWEPGKRQQRQRDDLKRNILFNAAKGMKHDHQMPGAKSQLAMSREYDVHRNLFRDAIRDLKTDGLLESYEGIANRKKQK